MGAPVSRDSTSALGNASRSWPNETIGAGSGVSVAPTMSPTSALPPICCQSDSVSRSYITKSLLRRMPDPPKRSVRSPTCRSNAMAVLHRGQYVMSTGTPPTTSLTISCHSRISSG